MPVRLRCRLTYCDDGDGHRVDRGTRSGRREVGNPPRGAILPRDATRSLFLAGSIVAAVVVEHEP
jgi:hypothetical protein